jgi:amidohydrolase/N-acyl-D-amino-acid deacylase
MLGNPSSAAALQCDLLIHNALLLDGSGRPGWYADLAVQAGTIVAIGDLAGVDLQSATVVDATGLVLAPGFIDVHTHDDLEVLRNPQMLAKLSQGVTTVITGNCGISAAPVSLRAEVPDPMNLLGQSADFCYPRFADYAAAVDAIQPAVNVAALVGHTALRASFMDRLDRAATPGEIDQMRQTLEQALLQGALGLSSGLAYHNAAAAPAEELLALAAPLCAAGAIYTTHLRTEFDGILDALTEAADLGLKLNVPVVVSHLKCAGVLNWGRSAEILDFFAARRKQQQFSCDCYPYSASSSTLDLAQVTADFAIMITWSEPEPASAGRLLADIAADWQCSLLEAATRLMPAGAVYHGMHEADVQQFLQAPYSMIGSDGLPCDPLPHPRLWGAFPRVLGHYCRDLQLFELAEAIHKMTGLSAENFNLTGRGLLREGYQADLVLFDPSTIRDNATFTHPVAAAAGIYAVWVNGVLSYQQGAATGQRAGRFLARQPAQNSVINHLNSNPDKEAHA